MSFAGYNEYRSFTKPLWLVVVFAAAIAVAASVFPVTQYTFSKSVALLAATFIAVILSQYELRLPKTSIEISVGDIIAIWGVFWLGVSGGVLLGAAASFSYQMRTRRISAKKAYAVAARTFAVVTAALTFSVGFGHVAFAENHIAELSDVNLIVGGTLLMTLILSVVHASLMFIFRVVTESTASHRMRASDSMFKIVTVSSLTITLCGLFAYFGLAFGLVVVPVVIFAIVSYRIHTRRLENKTAQILEASRIQLATVEALATAIDARDQVGSGHVRRTQIYAVGLGRALGLSKDEISALRTGALLHDIGKLAVPDHILSKPGPLTAAEIVKTKIHASVGASILEQVGFNYPVVPAVRHHHESWDGTGYPDGLAGERIPLTARILAVADTYDTLRSARPFRPPVTRDKAREMMIEKAGAHFDPKVVGVFLKLLSGLENEIAEQGLAYSEEAGGRDLSAAPSDSYVEQIKLANREVFTLYELAREFGSSANLDEMLALFTNRIKQLIPFDTCAVYLIDHTKKVAQAAHVAGLNWQIIVDRRIKIGEGATGVALKKRQLVSNVNPDLDFSLSQLELIQQYSTMAALPLMVDNELIGAVSIYSVDLESYEDEHLRLLETVSRIAAEAIGKSQQHAEAQAHALTDPMTGLPNARSLQIQFEKEVGRASRFGSTFQVLVLDLDGFKLVNDNFGHLVGDEMLREVGAVIQQQLRDYDFLARYGGDEFVALIPETGYDGVVELCSRIESAVAAFRLPVDGGRFASVGVSLGSAGYLQSGSTFDQMIVAADKAMYARKSSRKLRNSYDRNIRTAPLSEILAGRPDASNVRSETLDMPSNEGFIIELDESHVISTSSVN